MKAIEIDTFPHFRQRPQTICITLVCNATPATRTHLLDVFNQNLTSHSSITLIEEGVSETASEDQGFFGFVVRYLSWLSRIVGLCTLRHCCTTVPSHLSNIEAHCCNQIAIKY